MGKIYVPSGYTGKPCYQVNNGYIRVYNTINNSTNNVVFDIYINQDYQIRQTTATYTSGTTLCDTINTYTDDFLYRVDLMNILIVFLIFIFFTTYIPWKLVCRFFRRFN